MSLKKLILGTRGVLAKNGRIKIDARIRFSGGGDALPKTETIIMTQ